MRDIFSTQQEIVNSKMNYTSKVGEKQFSDVWKRRKSRESNIKVSCSWFAGPTWSPYFNCSAEFKCTKCVTELNTTADVSKTRSEIVNSLWYIVPILHDSLLNHMTIITKGVGASYTLIT